MTALRTAIGRQPVAAMRGNHVLPIIARAGTTFMTALPRLFPDLTLTDDDQFLIRLNSVFSNIDPFATGYGPYPLAGTGYGNHPRYYQFDQRLPFEPMPKYDLSKAKNINDIVETRAAELVNRGQPLKVFWSGGIDSTLATAAILSQLKHEDQVQVYHTCESIRENPYFFDHIQKHNVSTVVWSDCWNQPFESDDLIVTGTSSDEITGSLDRSFFEKAYDQLQKPWQRFFSARGFGDLVERCEELFAQSHSPIETLFDARWWFYFYIRHTYFARKDWDLNLENDFANNTVQFFNSPEFDAWSVHNKSTVLGSEYRQYKMPFKQATACYWNNQDYVTNKEKDNSIYASLWTAKKLTVLGNHHLFIYQNKLRQYKKFVPASMPFVSKTQVMELLDAC